MLNNVLDQNLQSTVLNKDSIENIDMLFNAKESPISKYEVEKIFVQIARLYLSDETLYYSMRAPLDEMFYQQRDSPDWQIYDQICERH